MRLHFLWWTWGARFGFHRAYYDGHWVCLNLGLFSVGVNW